MGIVGNYDPYPWEAAYGIEDMSIIPSGEIRCLGGKTSTIGNRTFSWYTRVFFSCLDGYKVGKNTASESKMLG